MAIKFYNSDDFSRLTHQPQVSDGLLHFPGAATVAPRPFFDFWQFYADGV